MTNNKLYQDIEGERYWIKCKTPSNIQCLFTEWNRGAPLCKLRKLLSKNDITFPFLSNGATDEKQFFHLKLLYCEFQKYDAMTMSEVCGQPKKTFKSHLLYKATKHIERTNLLLLLVIILLKHAFRSCCRALQDLRNCARDAKMRAADVKWKFKFLLSLPLFL